MHPTRIGPYLIERKIGSGGMGTVYYARHADTGEEAAVKVLPASLAREEGFIARFNREVSALQKLKNPHVIQLFENGVDGETYYYAMEYVEGQTLAALMRQEKRIGWREVIDISMQICSALKAAHDAGIIHRDLKPSNLLIANSGMIKLTDFGIAQVFAGTKLTATGGIIGTAEYMSPEQAQGNRVTKRSDLYSLGAVMYAMLTGRPPFSGKTTIEVIQKHRYGQFDRPGLIVPEIPRWLEEIVCKLLEKEPDKRFADAYVLFRRLQEVVRKVELSAQEQTLGRDEYDGTAPTVASVDVGAAGSGTLMHDLMRAEIDRTEKPSPVGELFNNTWVLVALLVLIVLGGVWWFTGARTDPQQQFEIGVALMNQPPGDAWLRARDEYFKPLLESRPDEWAEKVEPYLRRIENYEAASDFWGRGRGIPRTEFQRFLSRAKQYYQGGEFIQAEQTLEALGALLVGQEEHQALYEQTQQLLVELRSQRTDNGERYKLLGASMDRAKSLVEQGEHDEARRIWTGVVELYGDDPGAQAEVEQARTYLDRKVTLGQ